MVGFNVPERALQVRAQIGDPRGDGLEKIAEVFAVVSP